MKELEHRTIITIILFVKSELFFFCDASRKLNRETNLILYLFGQIASNMIEQLQVNELTLLQANIDIINRIDIPEN